MSNEAQFRTRLRNWMKGQWIPSWHEYASGATEGVPDCSFLMNNQDCETGWIELKSTNTDKKTGYIKFDIRSSQHQWMDHHVNRVPCWFLCEVDTTDLYLVPGMYHDALARRMKHGDLFMIGKHYKYDATDRSDFIAELIKYTLRVRT